MASAIPRRSAGRPCSPPPWKPNSRGNTKSSPRGRTVGPRLGRSRRPQKGSAYLLPCLETHKPVDLVIIMLGTNDLKHRFGLSPYDVARGVAYLAGMVKTSEFGPGNSAPAVLIVAPPPFGELSAFDQEFEGGAEKSLTLGRDILAYAAQKGFPCFDAGGVIRSSDRDGIHLEPEEHRKLGAALASRWSISSGSLVRRHRLRSPHHVDNYFKGSSNDDKRHRDYRVGHDRGCACRGDKGS